MFLSKRIVKNGQKIHPENSGAYNSQNVLLKFKMKVQQYVEIIFFMNQYLTTFYYAK